MNIYYFLVPFLFFVLLGILGAILLRLKIKKEAKNTLLSSTQNENDKKPDPHGANGGGHPPKIEEKKSPGIITFIWGGLGITLIILVVMLTMYLFYLVFGEKEKSKAKLITEEIVKYDYTPISINLDFRPEIETDGQDTIYIKLPGVLEPVEYSSGRGEVKLPPRRSGITEIYAKNRSVKVKIKKMLQ